MALTSSPSATNLDRFDELIRRGLATIACSTLVVVAVICLVEVVLRNLGGRSLGWYDELVGYLLVALTFIGTAMAQQAYRHISVDILAQRLSPGVNRARRLLVQAVLLGIQSLIVVLGSRLAWSGVNEWAITVPLPMGLVYAVLPVAALLAMMVHLVQVARILRDDDVDTERSR